jgi:hypothetical protein
MIDEEYQEKDILEDEAFKKSLAEKRTALINEIKSGKAAADKNKNTSNKGTQTVEVSNFDMPFGSMGPNSSIGISGLFQLDNGKEYMVPLKYLTEKAALNYINK